MNQQKHRSNKRIITISPPWISHVRNEALSWRQEWSTAGNAATWHKHLLCNPTVVSPSPLCLIFSFRLNESKTNPLIWGGDESISFEEHHTDMEFKSPNVPQILSFYVDRPIWTWLAPILIGWSELKHKF